MHLRKYRWALLFLAYLPVGVVGACLSERPVLSFGIMFSLSVVISLVYSRAIWATNARNKRDNG